VHGNLYTILVAGFAAAHGYFIHPIPVRKRIFREKRVKTLRAICGIKTA